MGDSDPGAGSGKAAPARRGAVWAALAGALTGSMTGLAGSVMPIKQRGKPVVRTPEADGARSAAVGVAR
ncbi:hypothetical protein ACFV2B_35005, partial [Streptomyces lavendulae]|uniref:hypothetical protein n=1 Tax=Streptomyces lavendulae TaxID=1914 RepID=UPI0036987E26